MSISARVFLSLGIILIDLVVFFLPLTAIFLAYVIWINPPWFREFLNRLNHAQ